MKGDVVYGEDESKSTKGDVVHFLFVVYFFVINISSVLTV